MNNKIIKPSILSGFMELLPIEQGKFNDILEKFKNIYEESGCLSMDTPIIEKSEVLLAKSAGETEKQVYRFNKGKNDLSLRFDLTVPLARYVAQYYNDLTFPFKRYQIGKVYRGERNQKGRYREFYQCDLDIIGNGKLSIYNDAFVISVIEKAFKSIGLKEYQFQISNRKILSGILNYLEIDKKREVLILIDKYDKITREEFKSTLCEYVGEKNAKYLNEIMDIEGESHEVIEKLKALKLDDEMFILGVNELETVINTLELLEVSNNSFKINLKIIRGLDYYTGTVVETLLLGNEQYGSICSGGRYENLSENYTKNTLPGVGISIGLTRLFFILKEIGFIDNYSVDRRKRTLIIPLGDTIKECCILKNKLTKEGKSVQIYFEDEKLKKKMDYANKLGIEEIIVLGEDEVKNNRYKVKNMATGEVEEFRLS